VELTDAGAALLREARRVLEQAEVARLAARTARDRATYRLRIGYVPAALPASVPKALQRLAGAVSPLETTLEPGCGVDLLDAVRSERLDAVVVPLPAPTGGLRVTALGDQRAVAGLPAGHRQAGATGIRLDQVAPERIVVLPREANRPFYDAVVAASRHAGLSPTLIDMPDGHVERALLAVASGAEMALLPECVAERYAAPGVRFVPLADEPAAFATAVVTRRDSAHMPTAAFLRAVSNAERRPASIGHVAPVIAVA
jgi:DNA-binding transcriptional LysR family regulator